MAVVVVAGVMTGLATVSLRGLTDIGRVETAAELLHQLDARVRMIAEKENRMWWIDFSQVGATARPAASSESAAHRHFSVRLDSSLRISAWKSNQQTAKPGVRIWVDADGSSENYGWSIGSFERAQESDRSQAVKIIGRFAGRTGQFSHGPQPLTDYSARITR